MDPDSMTTAVSEESDGPSCAACEHATCAGPELEPQDTLDVVERGLPQAVEDELPRVVERELPDEIDAVESSIPYPDADPTNRCRESANMIERGFSSSTAESAPRPVRRRGRRKPHRPRTPSEYLTTTETEVISVLVGDGDDNVARVREVEVARPPRDAASITQLPGLSWKRDLKRGGIEQVCMIVPEVAASVAAVELDVHASASDTQMRPKEAEPKTAREARFAAREAPPLPSAPIQVRSNQAEAWGQRIRRMRGTTRAPGARGQDEEWRRRLEGG
ncbi:hypothetical protein PI124_g16448 [Phytophthora idaei]|nr:hypothetical protein PI125_g18158 [Phytophthora idaei]KAG3128743.1 hypothetical protein PI126_g21265 [Phytophthora idaei]KAG3238587.1 hypothetical protein PI124_g16448 [Phytophthora idaei]